MPHSYLKYFYLIFFWGKQGNSGVWTQSLKRARQAFNSTNLSHTLSTFCFSYFSKMLGPSTFCLDHSPPIYTFWLAWMTGMHHPAQIFWDGVFLIHCPVWSQAIILPISISWVADIADTSPRAQPKIIFKNKNIF
jgi:hypothetical protein